ncbi:MAG TPA: hypothetical protein VH062_10825 [Polyangiaceae bacterium]|jgi:hypothetical protein|nr:hypothetical protein [Polyangiaceae bacterium]
MSVFLAFAAVSTASMAKAEDITAVKSAAAPRPPDDVDVDPWMAHRFAIEAHAGVGTPVGYVGGIFEYGVSGLVAVGAGLGTGSGPYSGSHLHAAVLARFRPVRGPHNAFSIGTAVSFGAFQTPFFSGDTTPVYEASWATFLQLDAGWEYRTTHGTLLRVALGFATLLNPGSVSCSPGPDGGEGCKSVDLKTLPTLDLALGQAF